MKNKYIYKNKKTGERKATDEVIKDKNWELIFERRNGMMYSTDKNIIQKNGR